MREEIGHTCLVLFIIILISAKIGGFGAIIFDLVQLLFH